MDPLSQGVVGAIYPQAIVKKKEHIVPATIIGFLSGMLPDIDSFIQFPNDPLAYVQYHRHFTHSIAFMPFGALIATLILFWFFRKKLSFKSIYIYAFVGYATHALLDSCTSYGTQLFLPFSNYRVAWDIIAIIDPLFTLPLLALVILCAFKKNIKYARAAVVYSLVFLSIGFIQRQRAYSFAEQIAEERGHLPSEITVKPTFANLVVWKMVYLHEGTYYVDAVRILFSKKVYVGETSPQLDLSRDFPWLDEDDVQYKDVKRFSWFSAGYLSVHPDYPDVIGDMRYSLAPNEIRPIWGIRLSPDRKGLHVPFESFRRDVSASANKLWDMILGR